jgi:hypothetical protein
VTIASHPTGKTRGGALRAWALVRTGLRAFLHRLADERRLRQAIHDLEAFNNKTLYDRVASLPECAGVTRW